MYLEQRKKKMELNTYRICFLKQGGEAFFLRVLFFVCDRDGDLGTTFSIYRDRDRETVVVDGERNI